MGKEFIRLAIKEGFIQEKLAKKLGVTFETITKWKKEDKIPKAKIKLLEELTTVPSYRVSHALLLGSAYNMYQWDEIVNYFADRAIERSETGYKAYFLANDDGNLADRVFEVMDRMGVKIPTYDPSKLQAYIKRHEEADNDKELIDDNFIRRFPVAKLLDDIFYSLNDFEGFYLAFFYVTMFDEDVFLGMFSDFEYAIFDMAAAKADIDTELATKLDEFCIKARRELADLIEDIKVKAWKNRIALKSELNYFLTEHPDSLSVMAEQKSFMLTPPEHPDYYMNKLLSDVELIHKVLPQIVEQLAIKISI